eukprot:TRINITY_DN46672_c0_g1_i21.p1 TRINITY_DN46672_c0_g1~~TRINITY_DN46672_c0_g1_i21.p1  ORF type:complete len:101 (+),score=20.97 TRINITY_DN46672_c0_g1_i21:296-598(+)
MPHLGIWKWLTLLSSIDSDWPDEYVKKAVEESKKEIIRRVILLLLVFKQKSSHPLMDLAAFLSTTKAMVGTEGKVGTIPVEMLRDEKGEEEQEGNDPWKD